MFVLGLLLLFCCNVNSFNIGATKPLGYFDPLGFSKNKPASEFVKLREAELKHARWGMVSSVVIPLTEMVTHKQSIHLLDDPVLFYYFVLFVSVFESKSLIGWEDPRKAPFTMRSDYYPGKVLIDSPESYDTFLLNAELNNGRLAMFGSIGMIAQELVTNKPLF